MPTHPAAPRPSKSKPFDLHRFFIDVRVVAVEVVTTVGFLYWIGKSLWHELSH
jgi:hypothetical protein